MKQNIKCPYNQSGICYHSHCIYIPDLDCMKRREYERKLARAHKITRNAIKHVRRVKRGNKS